MKVSIITICYNSAATIEATLRSVVEQTFKEIEYIIVDGGSTDGTLTIIENYKHQLANVISEKDNGIYDAINKGIDLATGDIIGLLHSDDFYADSNVITAIVNRFNEEKCEAVYGDLHYVKQHNPAVTVRTWVAGSYHPGLFLKGWMPPHPTFFVRKEIYEKYGKFNLQLRSSADYELMLRFLHKHRIKVSYLPQVLVKMRVGGQSNVSVSNRIKANREDRLAWKLNKLQPKWYTLLLKPLSKISQFF